MSTRTLQIDEPLYRYLLDHSLREPEALRWVREATAKLERHAMQISPEQGQFMAFLIELTGARRCLEVGTFTGYSALAVALALPADGHLLACELDAEFAAIARGHFRAAGVEDRIELRVGKAMKTLDALIEGGQAGAYDFAFIDADKKNYLHYYERCLTLIRPGGLIAIDNVLWSGGVIDPANQAENTLAIRRLNAFLHGDERISLSLVPIGDGLTLARKRA